MSVDNTLLRQAFLALDAPPAPVVCHSAKMYVVHHGRREPDTLRLRRALGLRPSYGAAGTLPTFRTTISVDLALRVADALGLDPHEAGL